MILVEPRIGGPLIHKHERAARQSAPAICRKDAEVRFQFCFTQRVRVKCSVGGSHNFRSPQPLNFAISVNSAGQGNHRFSHETPIPCGFGLKIRPTRSWGTLATRLKRCQLVNYLAVTTSMSSESLSALIATIFSFSITNPSRAPTCTLPTSTSPVAGTK